MGIELIAVIKNKKIGLSILANLAIITILNQVKGEAFILEYY